ncbi:zinc finger protein 208-like [Stegastes partitus]|uniref:Zinc finger protein 208-like n=1 Tax=Stegastes partitus TaxID=144197 RepID=A0A9Y4K7T4_9TELE|nr:PREDICTED: zinc finger protein 208-like [Stegastes partitus]
MAEAPGGEQKDFDWSETEDDDDEEQQTHTEGDDKCDLNNATESAKDVQHVDDNITTEVEKNSQSAPAQDVATAGDRMEDAVDDDEDRGEDSTVKQKKCRLVCKECGKRFDRRETFNLHRHFHAHEDELMPLTCKECGLTFQHRSSLIKHRNEHKEKEEQLVTPKKEVQAKEEGSFECAECQKIFATADKLRDHSCSNTVEKPYHCPLCRQEFQFKVSVTKHMMMHSLESHYTCQECNQTVPNAVALRIHQRCHNALKPYECPECGMVFKHYSVMEDHRRRHTDNSRSHLCNICGKTFKYSSLLHQHQYLHTGQKPFRCPECGKQFAFAQNMKAHCRQHRLRETISEQPSKQPPVPVQEAVKGPGKENTNQSEEPKRTFNCPLCPQTYCVPANLRAHMLIHEAEYEKLERTPRPPKEINKYWEKGHTCPHCPSVYRDESSLNVHLLSVHKSVAQYLEKMAAAPPKKQLAPLSSENMQGKWKSENISVKSYKCSECGKTFRHRSVLELHMRIHSKDKPYQCKVCNKGFRFSSYLQQHLIIHTGKKPYKCPDCGKDFAFLQNMRTHQKLHQEKPFRCTSCRKGYSDETQLQHHMLSHNGDKPHKCDLCDKSFGLAYLLRDHMNTHTGERPHRCDECHKTFSWFSSLLVHQKIHARKRQGFSPYNSLPNNGGAVKLTRTSLGELALANSHTKMDESAPASIRGEDGAENKPCDGETTSENSIGPRTEDTADRVGVFCCRDCGEAFREEAAYLEHRRQHPQENMYLNEQLDGLREAEKDNEAPLLCTVCSLSFVELSEFHSHMKETHDQIAQEESGIQINSGITKQHSYECPDCGKSYVVIGHFLNHRRSHSQPTKSVFNDLEHLKKKSFQCESCGRNYSRASALDAHRRCHEEKLVKSKNRSSRDATQTGESVLETKPNENQTEDYSEKLYECSCGKSFSALMRLKTHQRFSRNSQCAPEEMIPKPKKSGSEFYCSECKKAFSGHIALFNHQRWHANHSDNCAKRFPCEECGKVFMTLTFYYRHQRTAHSDETPAKSFLHQVCQLQKKAFECKSCGLKFSRASALHSHELQHTDAYKETEEAGQMRSSLLSQDRMLESGIKENLEAPAEDKGPPESFLPASMAEEIYVNDTDEDMESYEPGDFDVQVISASESEDEPVQDLNPDLELLCESDQDVRDDEVSLESLLVSKPEMDLKIVEVDFEQADEQCALIASEAENATAEERFDCPECYRWFTSPSSLRVHRMWHGVHRRRQQQNQGQSVAAYTCDTCGHEARSVVEHCNHIQTHNDQNLSSDILDEAEGLEGKNLTCKECGKFFSRLSALVSHQLHHPKRKPFRCPECMMSYSHAASLFNHMKTCSAQKKENISASKKEYNPKKTLLGPKIYHCEQCGKGFWSLGAYSHHKQSQTECTDLRLRKGVGSLHSVNGHQRSSAKVACPVCGRKFRHRGIMALHMRKHENGNHKCELCNRSFRLFSSLLRHQVVHSDQLLPPPIKSFQHQVEQLKKNTYSCPDCGKLFSREKALQFHMKSHGYETGHSPSSPRSTVGLEDLQCATCLAHFSNKVSLRAHQKLCIKRESHVVAKTELLENNDDLKLHKESMEASTEESSDQFKVHAEIKNETDDVGSLENPSTSNLEYNFYKRMHSEDVAKSNLAISVVFKKPKDEPSKGIFHCSECGRRFMTNAALGSHKRWHKDKKWSRTSLKDDDLKPVSHKADDGPFHCDKCDKQFFNHRVLKRHQMFSPHCHAKTEPDSDKSTESSSDTSEPFACPECNKTFAKSSLLVSHYENEHSEMLDGQGDEPLEPLEQIPGQADVNCSGKKSVTLKPKSHQCNLCSMTFAKARGLRAHKWQAHSKSTKGKNKVDLSVKTEPVASSSEVSKKEDSPAPENAPVMVKNSPVIRGKKKIGSDPLPASCLDCGKRFSSAGGLLEHKKVCPEATQGSKLEVQTLEAEVPPSLGRLSEQTVKCLFKCDKCGKAFQTEEHLGNHKAKAKSRPYCCALCCHGFWTENQLQQHLAWHDEVRCRLPNEVRYRLSAAMTSKLLRPNLLTADGKGKPFLSSATGQSQSSHKCQRCGKAFLSPTALQNHETEQCTGGDSYRCSVCPRTFSEIQDLIDHHQECISDYKRPSDAPAAAVSSGDTDGLTCLECGTTFCQETDLHQHYIEHARGAC